MPLMIGLQDQSGVRFVQSDSDHHIWSGGVVFSSNQIASEPQLYKVAPFVQYRTIRFLEEKCRLYRLNKNSEQVINSK